MSNFEVLDPANNPRNSTQIAFRHAITAMLVLMLAWLLLITISACMSRSLEFDGAMNLAVAKNLAEGHGPREVYDSRDLFPFEVQTRGPYFLLGAAIFRVFGVGPFQTQLPNLIFVGLLCGLAFALLRRAFDVTTALVGCVLFLSTPSFIQHGLRGYGEIPTFFFGLAALAVVAWPGDLHKNLIRRSYFAGAFAGLAVATKVIGISEVAMAGIVLLSRVTVESRDLRRDLLKACAGFAAGILTPLALIELWRLSWLGVRGYVAWWQLQWSQIKGQSGAESHHLISNLWKKPARHFGLFSHHVGLGATATSLLIAVPCAAMAFSYFGSFSKDQRLRSRWLLLGISTLTALYFIWWMAVVPDDKASLRYIYIGLIGLEILAAISLITNLRAAIYERNIAMRIAHASFVVAILWLFLPSIVRALERPISFKPDAELSTTRLAAKLISELPADRMVLGYGWYSAPTIQIYSHRRLIDLSDWPIGRLVDKPAYLTADRPSLVTGALDQVLARYPHKSLMQPTRFAQIYEVDFSRPRNPFHALDHGPALSWVAFSANNYPYTEGMDPFDPIGGRFIESDSEILLRYTGQKDFEVEGYMDTSQPSYYRFPTPISGKIFIDGCAPLEFHFKSPGWSNFKMPLNCTLQSGSDVRARILLDNTMDLSWLRDHQRAMLLSKIGFMDPAPEN